MTLYGVFFYSSSKSLKFSKSKFLKKNWLKNLQKESWEKKTWKNGLGKNQIRWRGDFISSFEKRRDDESKDIMQT